MNILIISANAIGDAFISMAAVEPLKSKYPDAKFYFILPERAAILNAGNERDFTFVLVKKNYFSLAQTIVKLSRIKFDRAYSFIPGVFNSFILFFVRSKVKAGEMNFIKRDRWDDKECVMTVKGSGKRKTEIKLDKYVNYLSRISTVLEVTDRIKGNINKYRPFRYNDTGCSVERILLHCMSSVTGRSLHIDLLEAAVKYLRSICDLDIVLVGSEADFRNEDLGRLSSYDIDYLIEPDLKHLIDAVRTSFFIGVDSFPVHIADAYDSNFVALFSMTQPRSVLKHNEKSISFPVYSFTQVSKEEFLNKLGAYFENNNVTQLFGEQELTHC